MERLPQHLHGDFAHPQSFAGGGDQRGWCVEDVPVQVLRSDTGAVFLAGDKPFNEADVLLDERIEEQRVAHVEYGMSVGDLPSHGGAGMGDYPDKRFEQDYKNDYADNLEHHM